MDAPIPTPDDLLAALEPLAAAATPRPWQHRPPTPDGTVDSIWHDDHRLAWMAEATLSERASWARRDADAAFIVALVNNYPAIAANLRRLAEAEADAEAGWKWAWSFDQWSEHGPTQSLSTDGKAEFQADLTRHENYGDDAVAKRGQA